MKRVFLQVSAAAAIFTTAPVSAACPSYLEIEAKGVDAALETAIWYDDLGWQKTTRTRLKVSFVTNFWGYPDAKNDLVVYPFYYSVPRRRMDPDPGKRIDLNRQVWIACGYEGAGIRLVRPLPDGASACLHYPKDEVVKCLFDAPRDPEDVMPEAVFGNDNRRAVVVLGSTRSCRLFVGGFSAGVLEENKSRAVHIPIGAVTVECQDELGEKTTATVVGTAERDVPFRFLWTGESNHWEQLRDLESRQ
ncbi:MAG: hypothetical protein MUE46_17885 [Xanthomonadales bacterium]|jgi:hypothetical protein|nr:hypothetical protein [Xanthomonadales bacterium]